MTEPPLASTVPDLHRILAAWRAAGARIALVPTMGALHAGHLAHLAHAKAHADKTVVSIFVNPAQFAPHEDFVRYPRDLETDRAKLAAAGGADLVYAPDATQIYPGGLPELRFRNDGPAAGLESEFRPRFFAGVVTVVEVLFRQVEPDIATFGEKDFQQLLVVKRLVRDLSMDIGIVAVPILREDDALALSSRNAYLSPAERKIAPALYRTLQAAAERVRSGGPIAVAEAEGAAALLTAGFDRVDYVAIRNAETLVPLREVAAPARVLAAAWLGKTRLIDNLAV